MKNRSRSSRMQKMKEKFLEQKAQIDAFYATLDMEAMERFLAVVKKVEGTLFLSGVGKSGYTAQKIAATLLSTGTKALFLDPLEGLHGDLGMVRPGDLVIFLSKSGQTDELFALIDPLRGKGATIAAISSNEKARLRTKVDHFLYLPCEKELCPFDLAPTTSCIVQLLFADVLTVELMKEKNFTLREYAENHPGGRIGRRSTLLVRDLMLPFPQTPFCFPEALLEEVLEEFTNKRCGCLLVIDKKKQLKGIFTDGDLRRALQRKKEDLLKTPIGVLMTPSPRFIEEDALAWDAVKLMEANKASPIMVLPVLAREKQEVIGIVKMHDLIQADI